MATRYIVGDPVVLSNTFTVDGTATDPTSVTLEVTDPSGNTDSYTDGDLGNPSTGVYTKTVTTDEPGTWIYKWTGTGAAQDVADGSFEVWTAAAVNATDILTLGEAKQAINLGRAVTEHDDELRQWISGVSQRIDRLCGPVVVRTISSETADGGQAWIELRETPVSSVTSVTEYSGTVAQTLTAETNSSKPIYGYLLDSNGKHKALLWRRSSNADARFPTGRKNVVVTYVAGRFADTASVDEKFKVAAGSIIRRLWHREAAAWARGGDPFETSGSGSVGFFRAVDPMIHEFLEDELSVAGIA